MPTWHHFLEVLEPRVWTLDKSLSMLKLEIQTLAKRSNFFSIEYPKSNKSTHIIYILMDFSIHHLLKNERSLDEAFLTWTT